MAKVGTNGGLDDPNVAVGKLIVDERLERLLKPGMTAEALFNLYAMCEDDFDLYAIVGDDEPFIPTHKFSALDYAKERCEVLTQAQAANFEHAANLAYQIATAPLFLLPEIKAPSVTP
ncbi:hypothetical protein [Bradyrhizobium erythrophlei]|uniref:Uncharacterized protein n=1 Tax=Bradyrhizobium erythrophlei TaxID=1437360 RepID=A0A1M7UV99_9BRAD|nr:hypothetical protein [Bradyrhizobium erythrophlei]SHN86961.1 hypothetical protein SAMN05444170_6938 [Bradyrhizobium erythrophlei]